MRAKLIFLRNSMLTWYQLPTSLMSIDVWVSLKWTSSTCKIRVAMRLVLLAGLEMTVSNHLVITVIPAINAFGASSWSTSSGTSCWIDQTWFVFSNRTKCEIFHQKLIRLCVSFYHISLLDEYASRNHVVADYPLSVKSSEEEQLLWSSATCEWISSPFLRPYH